MKNYKITMILEKDIRATNEADAELAAWAMFESYKASEIEIIIDEYVEEYEHD